MESTALSVLAFMVIAFSIKEIALGWTVYRQRRKLQRIIEIEQAQHLFAEARNLLLEAVMDGDLNPRSETFRTLYFLNTALLRRPHMCHAISALISLRAEQSKLGNNELIEREVVSWTPKVVGALLKTTTAMKFIVWDLSPSLRFAYRIQKLRNPELTPLEFVYGHKEQLQSEESQKVEVLHAVQERFQTLATMGN